MGSPQRSKTKWVLSRTTTGRYIGTGKYKDSVLFKSLVNCGICPWNGTDACPNGMKKGEFHTNGYCTFWFDYVREFWETAGTKPKLFQMANVVKNQMIVDEMFIKYKETGELPKEFHQHMRNQITLTDKMRRQDEGIKMNTEVTHQMDELRTIIDIQAKNIEKDKNIVEADYEEQDNKGRHRTDEEEV